MPDAKLIRSIPKKTAWLFNYIHSCDILQSPEDESQGVTLRTWRQVKPFIKPSHESDEKHESRGEKHKELWHEDEEPN